MSNSLSFGGSTARGGHYFVLLRYFTCCALGAVGHLLKFFIYLILIFGPLITCCRYGSPALAFGREIIVFRAKHNDEDWKRVDILLGGNGTVPSQMHANDASKKKIPVNNKTISEQGHLNMCKALCHEIQVYKQLMNAAINLNEDDVRKV